MPSTNSIYIFRHIQTQQVLISLRQSMKSRVLNQLGTTVRPTNLRKDLWRPLVALTGFQTTQAAQAVTDALLHHSKDLQLKQKMDKDHILQPKRLRVVEEKNMVEKSIVALRKALESVAASRNETRLLALWEQPYFMELKGDKEWPSFLEHGQLELRNNRFVKGSKQ
ncbi:uncharacterized protein BX663DRAFT_110072 [Cokeromyces recurvatus]|uniref:uncharacterized protein n=1 Tax=Cokeromyces recurvatus TaxID=90255 RepID=UPI00221FA19D|nr:uncharacterized protein BX663DRAFT_110072 [Cokeromyces recurvatus]KAI7901546.1 hypothetical protein BX663DRAFT_110072 [Cokeromyces recurvatus]